MITYNHENYIKEAILSVLDQKVDCDFELVISNDHSSDQTHFIIETIKNTHPKGNNITYYHQNKNLGMMPNFIFALNKCQGDYIALCEGDDFWTDSLKLQKQLAILEHNETFSYCGHAFKILNSDGVYETKNVISGTINFEDIVERNALHTATLMFRKTAINKLPTFFKTVKAGDWILQFVAMQFGHAYVIDEVMSVYRKHDKGVWSQLDTKKMGAQGIDVLRQVKRLYKDKKTQKSIDSAIKKRKKEYGLPMGIFQRIKQSLNL